MKRPQGFDQPVRRAAQVGERMPRSTSGRPSAPARAGRTPSAAASAADGMVTEPLAIPRGGAASPPTVSGTVTEVLDVEPVMTTPRRSEPDPPVPTGAGASEGGTSDRAARRALARAARQRRRYERQEVRRFTRASRRRRLVWGSLLGSIVALVVGVAAVAYSPLMALRDVRVEGASRVPAAEVRAAFDDVIGTPLPLVTAEDVQEAIAGFRLIETYRVETVPPDTLVLRIVERTPVGVIEDASGVRLVDGAGVVIETLDVVPEGHPRIEVQGGVASDGFRAAASVIRALPADLRPQVVRVVAASSDDVRLELASGARVQWGGAGGADEKAAALAALMVAAPPDTVTEYDVSSPSTPVTR